MVDKMVGSTSSFSNVHGVVNDNSNPYRNMVINAMRINQGYAGECSIVDEESDANVTKFFNLLKDSNELLWDVCTNHSKLLVVAQVFTSSQIISWVMLVTIESLNKWEVFYLKVIGRKRAFILLSLWWNHLT